MYNKLLLISGFLIIGLLCSLDSAAFDLPDPTPGSGGCIPPDCVPIDGGLSLLLAAGVALGGKKLYKEFKN